MSGRWSSNASFCPFLLRSSTVLVTALAGAAACGSDGDDDGINDACNPLGGVHCMMPWPSSTYLSTDSSTVIGFRLDVPIEAMPINQADKIIDPAPWNRRDGFSHAGRPISRAYQ